MNKEEFFDALQQNLDYVPQNIIDRIINDYDKKFSSDIGKNTEDIINDMGSFHQIISDIKNTYNLPQNPPSLANTFIKIIKAAIFLALVFAIIPFCINIIVTYVK